LWVGRSLLFHGGVHVREAVDDGGAVSLHGVVVGGHHSLERGESHIPTASQPATITSWTRRRSVTMTTTHNRRGRRRRRRSRQNNK
jgi:hypothetical protein